MAAITTSSFSNSTREALTATALTAKRRKP